MTQLKINNGVVLDYSQDGWAEFKKWLDGTYASLTYTWIDEGLAYNIVAIDGRVYRTCSINKDDATEFETNYKKTKAIREKSKVWNTPLKNGSSSNMAVNGSSPPVVFSLGANANADFEIQAMCLIAEFTGSVAIGNKFLADAIGTLANGLLVEAKVADDTYSFGNLKRTRDLIEISQPQGGFNVIAGTTSLIQIFFYVPPRMTLARQGAYATDDYIKATVRDNLTGISYMEMFAQGVKL